MGLVGLNAKWQDVEAAEVPFLRRRELRSPYLKERRLSDVIAGITALGTYKFYKLNAPGWADRISGSSDTGPYWRQVFEEQPEFFRFASGRDKIHLFGEGSSRGTTMSAQIRRTMVIQIRSE